MVEELIYNLLDNAIQYNHPGGNARVSLERTDKNVIITVKDTGIGIPADQTDRVFERFYRVDKSRSKRGGGTGLGLAIVKHIAEYHGGSVLCESTVDEGTTFICTFPDHHGATI